MSSGKNYDFSLYLLCLYFIIILSDQYRWSLSVTISAYVWARFTWATFSIIGGLTRRNKQCWSCKVEFNTVFLLQNLCNQQCVCFIFYGSYEICHEVSYVHLIISLCPLHPLSPSNFVRWCALSPVCSDTKLYPTQPQNQTLFPARCAVPNFTLLRI